MKALLAFLLVSAAARAALLSVGPDYRRPSVAAPDAYRDLADSGAWKAAAPADELGRGSWWQSFRDPTLDGLETRALSANQDLRAAAARVQEAQAAAGIARSSYWPQAAINAAATRTQLSTTAANLYPASLYNDFNLPVVASWEIDLFGRVRRLSESARDEAAAQAALFESVRLSLAAGVATNYFSLRGADHELAILRETVGLRRRELDLVSAQRRSGAATDLDVARAQAELAGAEADSAAVAVERESLQDALAVLVGEPAPSFTLPASNDEARLPAVPAGLPSSLLERRPDIAAAERSLAAANARIGVAKAAFFPAISLTGSAGFDSGESSQLFGTDSRIWSIGPAVYLPIFQGGRNRANLERSKAAYDESLADYRQQVLAAFREVQEALAARRLLADEAEAEDRAVAASRRAASLSKTRYTAGYVSYLDVVDAQRTELGDERAAARLAAQCLNTDVALIKALGGGWRAP